MDRLIVLLLAVALSTPAWATNGYFSHGFGTASKAMAGAGMALPQDTLIAASNPAGMLHIGERMDIGLALFNPERGYVADSNGGAIPPGKQDSDNTAFLVPSFGRNWQLNEESTLGLSIGANGGMNTEYSDNPFRNFGPSTNPAGIDLTQVFIGVTWAHQLSEKHSIGITPMAIVQSLKVQGLQPFQPLSIHPNHVTNRGRDWSTGAAIRIGWLGKMNDRLDVGASVQSRGYMSEFDKYKGLLAEEGDFDLPPQINLGLAWKFNDRLTGVVDYQHIFYSEIDSLANPNDLIFAPPNNLGGDDGLGFGWDDVGVIKLGLQWQYSDSITLRTGYSYASEAIDHEDGLFNILAPAVVKHHVSVGGTWHYAKDAEVNFAFTHAPEKTTNGSNPNTAPQTGSLYLEANELEISWSKRF